MLQEREGQAVQVWTTGHLEGTVGHCLALNTLLTHDHRRLGVGVYIESMRCLTVWKMKNNYIYCRSYTVCLLSGLPRQGSKEIIKS